MENTLICNCMQVRYNDIVTALHEHETFSDVLKAFEHVKDVTHCSTGCGGCHDTVLDIISHEMMK